MLAEGQVRTRTTPYSSVPSGWASMMINPFVYARLDLLQRKDVLQGLQVSHELAT